MGEYKIMFTTRQYYTTAGFTDWWGVVMKEQEKQIKEMAKDYYGYSIDLEDDCKFVAEEMYNKGHRKLPEDSVVLSRKEYEKLKYTWITDSDAYKKGCKEMAEKIFKMLISELESNQFLSGERIIMEVDVENLAKQFGVEIKE